VPFHAFMNRDDIDCVIDRLVQTAGVREVRTARAI
jgi:hypothetical protein